MMDHLTQQHKLFPQLAKSIIFKLTADYIWDMYNTVTSELDKGQLERLPEVGIIYIDRDIRSLNFSFSHRCTR